MRSNDDAQTFRNKFYTLPASSPKPQLSSRKLQVSKPTGSKLLAPGPKVPIKLQASAVGSVGSAGQAPNSRFRVQSFRLYLFPQILSPQYSNSRPEPQPRPQPHVPHASDARPSPQQARAPRFRNPVPQAPGASSRPKAQALRHRPRAPGPRFQTPVPSRSVSKTANQPSSCKVGRRDANSAAGCA